MGVLKVHDFVHHTVRCDVWISLLYLGLTMLCLRLVIVGHFANWVFRQDFFLFDICKVKLGAVSFWGNWLFLSLSWLGLILFWLDLALDWPCTLFDWLFMMFDWFGTTLNGLKLMLSLLLFGWLILSLFLSRLFLGMPHGRSRRDRGQIRMLWFKVVIIIDWLFMLVVLMSHHGTCCMVRNSTVHYGRVPWMATILDCWVYVVSRLISIRMIHLGNLLVIIMRSDT